MGLGADDVELGCAARLGSGLRELQGLLLGVEVLPRGGEQDVEAQLPLIAAVERLAEDLLQVLRIA